MKKIESFKTFSQIQNQIKEEARQKEIASKREASVAAFNELLSKYNASSIEDLNEEDRDAFMAELTAEGNAFGAARAEAIAKGEDTFKVGDEEMPVKNVDKEDEENAEEFANESALITEGTRGQFGKIYKNGEIASVYTHYDSYPEHMLNVIKKGYPRSEEVDVVLSRGNNSGLEVSPDKMNFYGTPEDLKPLKGSVKNLKKYIKDARGNGAEYIYLFDDSAKKWFMVDVYGDQELVPAFESVVTEGKHDAMLDQLAELVKDVNFMNVGIKLKEAGIKYDFSTGMMPMYKLHKHPIAIVNKKYVDKGDREVGDIAIGVLESLQESFLINEELDNRSLKDARKGHAAIEKFFANNPAFNSKQVSDPTVGWLFREALKAALIDANFHEEAKSAGRAINFANFSAPTVFLNDFGGMPVQISKSMMMEKVYELATEVARGAGWNGYAIIEAIAMALETRFKKNSSPQALRDMISKFMGEGLEANNLEQRINEGSAFNSARLKAIEAGEKEFEFDGKKYPVTNVDKEDEELAKELVDEGSAFNSARLKAIAAGEDEFEFDGKKYPVKSVDKEDKELAKELTERLDNSTMKRMSGLSDQRELSKFKEAFVNMAQSFYEEGFEFDDILGYMDAVMRDPNVRGSIEEGNAFLGARAKAIEEEAEEFEFNGKKYPVTIKEANEPMFEAFVEIDAIDPEDGDLLKLLKKNKVEMEVMSYGGPAYAQPIVRLEGKEKDIIKVLMDQDAGWSMEKKEAEYLVEESAEINESSYDERLQADFMKFIEKAENKMVRLTTTEFDGTSTVEGKLKKGPYGLHKIDYMGFNFDDELESIRSGEGMIMGVRVGQFLKYKIGPGKYGSEFLIEVL